jgi:hypothetical protein
VTYLSFYRPANKQELFNLRRASARNVIERIFGVLKRKFRILLLAPEYSLETQARIPTALCALHNFIRQYDPVQDDSRRGDGQEQGNGIDLDMDEGIEEEEDLDEPVDPTMATLRDTIATAMWEDYQNILHDRMMDVDDLND